jgi:hypothetical protein
LKKVHCYPVALCRVKGRRSLMELLTARYRAQIKADKRGHIAPLIISPDFVPRLLLSARVGVLAVSLLVSPAEALAVGRVAISKAAMTTRVERIAVAGVILPFLQPITVASLLLSRVISPVATVAARIAIVGIVSASPVSVGVSFSLSLTGAFYCASPFYCAGAFYFLTATPITVPVIVTSVAAVISIPIPTMVPALSLNCRSRNYSGAKREAQRHSQPCCKFLQ